MALILQDDDGIVEDANAYIDVDYFKAYHDSRGNSYSAYTDDQIDTAIVRATDYADQRFQFRGIKLADGQTTEWPRQASIPMLVPIFETDLIMPPMIIVTSEATDYIPLVDLNNQAITGIPVPLKKAVCEYALRALAAGLFADNPPPSGGRMIDELDVQVDVIRKRVKYSASQATGTFVMPGYPPADLWLARAGLIQIGRQLTR